MCGIKAPKPSAPPGSRETASPSLNLGPPQYEGHDQKRESSLEDDSRFAQWATPRATTKALGRGRRTGKKIDIFLTNRLASVTVFQNRTMRTSSRVS
jgi:hypothetical protein